MSAAKNKLKEIENNDTGLHGQYKTWFLDYASYVILERAVPAIEDGLKPVQRRILHAMKEMDDGRFNKVANVIGQTMQYHPHGDASIQDAMINLGQKNLLIDTQGNWGDVRTGDDAAAPRYIEARLSKFALDVAFNSKTTEWQLSYDGRKNEPVTLPMKFPLLLAQGADGIAVGLATKILPHNFCELIDASIKYLRGKRFELYPDFQTGGQIDVDEYNQGKRGGKVKVRAHIEELDKKTVVIKSVPYGVTTTQVMDSIVKANDQGKIKIKKVTDNTAADVEIQVDLAPGISPDITIDALYKFTDCEISISPNACVIVAQKPQFLTVTELLRISTDHTKDLLQQELKIKLSELQEKWHYTSLEKIFFEEKIYKELEKKHATWDKVLEAIDDAFKPFKKQLKREITREDIIKLTEKPVRRIYKLDIDELNDHIKGLEADIKAVKVADKSYIGKDIMHAAVFQKNDERTTYNMIYMDGKTGKSFAKRFNVTGVTRDKEYFLANDHERSKVHYLSINPNAEAEIIKIVLTPGCKAHKKEFEYNFSELEITGRSSKGITVTKYPIKSDGVKLKEAGVSTIAGKKLWYDDQFGRLSTEEKGRFIGTYEPDDKILVAMNDGNYMITDQELSQKFDAEKVLLIEKFNPEKTITAVYADMDKKQFMAKRFKIETTTLRNKFMFIKEGEGNYVAAVSTDEEPVLSVQQGRGAQVRKGKLKIAKIAEISGWRTVGTRLLDYSKSVEMEWVKQKGGQQAELFN